MKIKEKVLENLLTYHPPKTEKRRKEHELVNDLVVSFLLDIADIVDDPAEFTTLFRKMQEVRMMCNQAITYKEEKIKIGDMYGT